MRCVPAFDFARSPHRVEAADGGVWFKSAVIDLALGSDVPLTIDGVAAGADFIVAEGEEATFIFGEPDPQAGDLRCAPELQLQLLKTTIEYWHRWLWQCTYRGRWREVVHRSALALKLLTFEPTGAI